VPREDVIRDAIKSQTFSAVLTAKEQARMQEIADILQAQGSLKTKDGKPFDVKSVLDLSWQKERKL
jgi:NitT/TauT family transport system substrate-binding protein